MAKRDKAADQINVHQPACVPGIPSIRAIRSDWADYSREFRKTGNSKYGRSEERPIPFRLPLNNAQWISPPHIAQNGHSKYPTLVTVKEIMRHKSIEMTLRYAHLAPAHKKAAVDALERALQPKEENKPAEAKTA